MTECRISEYCKENSEIILFADDINEYLQYLFISNAKLLADCDSHKLISFFIASYLKDLNECCICFKAGLLNSVPLLLKKIIETWRYIIYYYYNKEEAQLLYNNDSCYKKPCKENLHSKVDAYINNFKIHILEDKDSLFHKDFIKNYYKELCTFSHLDILQLKASVLDGEARINLYINAHKEVLNRFLITILILQRLLCELYMKFFEIDDGEFNDYYKACVLNLNKTCNT